MVLVRYEAHMASSDDSNEGWIWIKPSSEDKKLCEVLNNGRRPIVCIKRENVKPVYGEALYADNIYLDKRKIVRKKDKLIFISAWYRYSLGIKNDSLPVPIELDVKPLHPLNLWALLYRYPRNHPQALVRASSMMGIIGFGLGVIGTGLGVVGIKDWLATNILSPYLTNCWNPFGFLLFGVGFAITLVGIRGLIRS